MTTLRQTRVASRQGRNRCWRLLAAVVLTGVVVWLVIVLRPYVIAKYHYSWRRLVIRTRLRVGLEAGPGTAVIDSPPSQPTSSLSQSRSRWRKVVPDQAARPVRLPSARLPYAPLRGAELEYANLSSAYLAKSTLSDANLIYADLTHAILNGADMSQVEAFHADLRNASMVDANLTAANLQEADLSGAELRRADLRAAYLLHSKLSSADLRDANLAGADLRYADLRGANLRGANVAGADLRGAKYNARTTWPHPAFNPVQRGAVLVR